MSQQFGVRTCRVSGEADLGLGRGLLPGAPDNPNRDSDELEQQRSKTLRSKKLSMKKSNSLDLESKRQINLSHQELDNLFACEEDQLTFDDDSPINQITRSLPGYYKEKVDAKMARKAHAKAEIEVRVLQQEMERCQLHLEAKYKAIKILQQQNQLLEEENSRNRIERSNLEKEINQLQFDLEFRESTFMNSQATWSERFDRICLENASLSSKLEVRETEVKKTGADKACLLRQRDELLSLIDVNERARFLIDGSSEEEVTSADLAVLGACHCNGGSHPCQCARSAAALGRQHEKIRHQCEKTSSLLSEANTLTDAYKIAFEEQLTRNRGLVVKLSDLIMSSTKTKEKAKTAMQWLVAQFEESPQTRISGDSPLQGHNCSKEARKHLEQDLINAFLQLVFESSEKSAHQLIAAHIWAQAQHNDTCQPSQPDASDDANCKCSAHVENKPTCQQGSENIEENILSKTSDVTEAKMSDKAD